MVKTWAYVVSSQKNNTVLEKEHDQRKGLGASRDGKPWKSTYTGKLRGRQVLVFAKLVISIPLVLSLA